MKNGIIKHGYTNGIVYIFKTKTVITWKHKIKEFPSKFYIHFDSVDNTIILHRLILVSKNYRHFHPNCKVLKTINNYCLLYNRTAYTQNTFNKIVSVIDDYINN